MQFTLYCVLYLLCILCSLLLVVANSEMSGGGEDGTLMEVQEGSKQTKFEDLPLAVGDGEVASYKGGGECHILAKVW